jgi:hypothetical protein
MRCLTSGLLAVLLGCSAGAEDIGSVDRPNPPPVEALVKPEIGTDLPRVGLRATIYGTVKPEQAKHLYIVVNPMSNPSCFNVWWVQEPVVVTNGQFWGSVQFGEATAGRGELFAVVAVQTDTSYQTGEILQRLPKGAAYSRLLIVKRD